MRRINFLRLAIALAIVCPAATPLKADSSTWKVKLKELPQNDYVYSVDPDERTLRTSGLKEEKVSSKSDQHDIDWDNLDTSSIDRVFESSSFVKDAEKPKTLKTHAAKAPLKKSSPEAFHSLVAEEGDIDRSTQDILNRTKEPKAFVSRGKVARLSNESLIAQIHENAANPPLKEDQTILINFNNVSIIEYIRFISRVSNKNFIFSEEDLQFTVTIVSEEPTTLENVLMALFQELHVRNLSVIEEGNTFIIHRTDSVKAPGVVVSDAYPREPGKGDIITRVFRLNVADAQSVAGMIQPLLSDKAVLQVLPDTNHIVLTDISSNIDKVLQLIKSVDAPNSSMVIGQYVVRIASIDELIRDAEQIMTSIARGQPITFVGHAPSNSIFIIAAPFLVERAIPVLQRLDQKDGTTGIFDLNELKYMTPAARKELEETNKRKIEEGLISPDQLGTGGGVYQAPEDTQQSNWRLDTNGNWIYETSPGQEGTGTGGAPVEAAPTAPTEDPAKPPQGFWKQNYQNHWEFVKGAIPSEFKGQQILKRPDGSWEFQGNEDQGPQGKWQYGSDSKWRFLLKPGASIFVGKKIRSSQLETTLPLGDIERTRFYIHKLQYRKGDSIQQALQQIGASLSSSQSVNPDLVLAIDSVQWLEPSNSLIVTGTSPAIMKVKELIDEIDKPLRQVFIEMLILDLAIDESLDLGVSWGSKFGGGNTAGGQAFLAGASPIPALLASAGINAQGVALRPAAEIGTLGTGGYNFGVVGQKISAGGVTFQSFAAFLRALHEKSNINVVLNPKILTEDNLTAELFVGENTPFKTQSIANDQGNTITSNFEFKDVGITLRVTPYLGNSNIVTLEIEYEQSSVVPGTGTGGGDLTNQSIGPTTRINRTKTRIHLPDGYFLVISGLIADQETRERRHVPCLGGAPIIGAAFTDKHYNDQKRNLMLFLRPQIIDTEIQMDNLTEHQQNIFRVKSRTKRMWKFDYEETLDWLNAIQTDPNNDEREMCQENDIWPHYREHQHGHRKRLCK